MIEDIIRDGTRVILEINTGFKIEKPILFFDWECREEYIAEMLRKHLLDCLKKFKHEIAQNPYWYLNAKEISNLKSKLVHEWDGSKHDWK